MPDLEGAVTSATLLIGQGADATEVRYVGGDRPGFAVSGPDPERCMRAGGVLNRFDKSVRVDRVEADTAYFFTDPWDAQAFRAFGKWAALQERVLLLELRDDSLSAEDKGYLSGLGIAPPDYLRMW